MSRTRGLLGAAASGRGAPAGTRRALRQGSKESPMAYALRLTTLALLTLIATAACGFDPSDGGS